ncbi:neogenin-like, partial [Tropilaelaps mercedesae]
VFVGATGTSTITIQWAQAPQSGAKGFIVYYRPDSDLNLGWREAQLDGRSNQYTLQHLIAGTLYQIYVSATNEFGAGDPSDIISMRTHRSLASDMTSLLSTALFGDSGGQPMLLNLFVLIPVLASLITIIIVVVVTCVCLHRIKARHARAILAGQTISLDPKTYMTVARSRMASMDNTCDSNPPSKLYLVPLTPRTPVNTAEAYSIDPIGSLLYSSPVSSGSSLSSPSWSSQNCSMRTPLLPKPRGPLPSTLVQDEGSPEPELVDLHGMSAQQRQFPANLSMFHVQTIVRTLPAGCVQPLDGKQIAGTGQPSPKQLPQPEYGQRYVDIQQPPPLPPDRPVGPPHPVLSAMLMTQIPPTAGATQVVDDAEALKRQQYVNEEIKTFLINHNGLPGMTQLPLQAQQV